MNVPASLDTPDKAGQHLAHSLLAMARHRTNPVLLVLDDPRHVEQMAHYPPQGMSLAEDRLRVYYHSHAEPWPRDEEHGHFHIFMAAPGKADQWSHLAALSMDREGQPRAWFVVNHWVTAGAWQPAEFLQQGLQDVLARTGEPEPLFSAWLLGMLGLYRNELDGLLVKREQRLQALAVVYDDFDAILQDRMIYELARQPLALLTKLGATLSLP